ncbi:MAG: Sulfocyanin (SoxE) domain [Actinomycetota bacterium]|jgi:plastocyanin
MRSPLRTSLAAAAAASSLGLLTACGGGSSAPAESLPADVGLVVKAVPSLRFDAEKYGPVKAGEVLVGYSNEDSVRHTLVVVKDDVKVPNFRLVVEKQGSVDAGPVTLEAGTYTLFCDVPGHSNMKATLVVE